MLSDCTAGCQNKVVSVIPRDHAVTGVYSGICLRVSDGRCRGANGMLPDGQAFFAWFTTLVEMVYSDAVCGNGLLPILSKHVLVCFV